MSPHQRSPLLDSFFHRFPDAIEVADTAGQIIYVNPAFENMTGYAMNEIVGQKTAYMFSRLDIDNSIHDSIWRTLSSNNVWRGELRSYKKNGSTWVSDTTISPICNTDGETVRYVVLKRDVTGERRLEEQLIEDQKRFQSYAEIGSDWFWELGTDLRFTFISHRFFEITGISNQFFMGKTILESDPERASSVEGLKLLADLDAHRPFRNFSLPLTAHNNRRIQLSISGNPVHDSNGVYAGYRGVGADVTKKKQAEDDLMRQNELFAVALDSMSQGLCMFDSNQHLIVSNKRYSAIYGLPTDLIKPGDSLRDIIQYRVNNGCHTDADAYLADRLKFVESEEASCRVKKLVDGRYIQICLQPMSNGGWLSLHDDVSERKRAEQKELHHRDLLQEMVDVATVELKNKARQLKKSLETEKELNALQRQFVSMASHEFRTPLTIIDGTAQRLDARSKIFDQKDTQKRARKIRNAVKRMTRLMESTLTAAQIEEGKIAVKIAPCKISNILATVCAAQQELAPNHRIIYNLNGLPDTIMADIGAVEQMLINLLTNAIKYAPHSPKIHVTARTHDENIYISVSDRGLGIAANDIPRMFERFFRAKSSIGIAGTGIGLHLVNTLVKMHDGFMSVESELGEGSIFTIRLPVAGPKTKRQCQPEPPAFQTEVAQGPEAAGAKG